MTVVETVLVFAGIPVGVIVVVAAAVLAPSAVRGQARYRPGRPWEHTTAWWLPEPSAIGATAHGTTAEHASVHGAIAAAATEDADRRGGVSPAEARAEGEAFAQERETAAVGGASGEW